MLPPKPLFDSIFIEPRDYSPIFFKSTTLLVFFNILVTYMKKIRCFHDKIL